MIKLIRFCIVVFREAAASLFLWVNLYRFAFVSQK